MNAVYVETSALLRALLEGDSPLLGLIQGSREKRATSALTFVEARRCFIRAAHDGRLAAGAQREAKRRLIEFEDSCDIISLGESILERASQPFPIEPVRSLDALHLASAIAWEREIGAITLLSCDDRIRRNAEAHGFDVLPPPRSPPSAHPSGVRLGKRSRR